MDNYILTYYQGIMNGSIVVGRWIKALYTKIVEGIENGEFIFDQNKANKAIRFIQRFSHHNKGKLAPGRLVLDLWQKAMISVIFGIVDEDGRRVFRQVFIQVGRKCGKTLISSSIMQYEAFVDGEFGSEIYCVAPKLDQADLAFSAFKFSCEKQPTLEKRIKPRKYDLYIKESNTTIKKIAFNEKKADGYNPQLVVCDEGSSWPGQRGLKQYEVMVSGTGARQEPLILMITSAGYEDEGIYDELIKRSTAYLNGDSREKRLLPFLYMIDDPDKWDQINELRKSLPGLGTSVSVQFMLDQIDKAYQSLSAKTEFMTKFACVKQNSSQAFLKTEFVQRACGDHISLESMADNYCVGGIDISMSTDLTSCCIIVEKNGVLHVISHFFLPSAKIKEATARDNLPYQLYMQRGILSTSGENYIDYRDVYRWFTSLIEQYHIYPLAIGADPYGAAPLIQDLNTYGFKTTFVKQGENLSSIINETEGRFADGSFAIGDNDLLKVHILDSAMHSNADNNRRRLVKLNSKCHIDGMAALLDAMCTRSFFHDEIGDQLKNEG